MVDESRVIALIDPDKNIEIERAEKGYKVNIVVENTPFYGEAGGQVGDTGIIKNEHCEIQINDTQRILGLFVHKGVVTKGYIKRGDKVILEIDVKRRDAIRRNHTATHLLHWALRTVIGPHATQKGSVVAPDYLRFDFAHSQMLSTAEIKKIEQLVNERVLSNLEVKTEIVTLEEARKKGAMMIFEEKYGERVRLVEVVDTSRELCGGTHVSRTGDIGIVKITRQESVSAGVRRIYAVTGLGALKYIYELEELLKESAEMLKEDQFRELPRRISKLLEEQKELKLEIEKLKQRLIRGVQDWTENIKTIDGIKVAGISLGEVDHKTLLNMCDTVREKLGSGIAVVGGKSREGKGMLAVVVTKDLTDRVKAPQIIKELTPVIGGKGGGGRDDLARGGGPHGDKIDEVIKLFYNKIREIIDKSESR